MSTYDLRQPVRYGLIASLISLSVSTIGMVVLFGQRELISEVLTMGEVLIFTPTILMAFLSAREHPSDRGGEILLSGFLTGLVSAIPLVAFTAIATTLDLRQYMPNVSPELVEILTFGFSDPRGGLLLLAAVTAVGTIAAAFLFLPSNVQSAIFSGLLWTLGIGLFSEILNSRLRDLINREFALLIFKGEALRPTVGLVIFILIAGLVMLRSYRQAEGGRGFFYIDTSRPTRTWTPIAVIVLIFVALPFILGTYLSEVINNVGIFILMGFGLNIVVGFAGLLDLGYVAFFAIGAYTMAILTSEADLGVLGLSFWEALPFSILASALAGILLGIPVLRMRGDYLAIVTLGFGEIIRILALSDLLKPFIGGAQGVLKIPKPAIGSFELIRPEHLYFVVLAGCFIAAFVSWRLSESRLGRQWMAMREDEDVAEAMGIRLVSVKLLAFGIGAAFSGLGGAIFASKLTSIFPHSFNLLISINVLSLIIVGGMGSLPGVVVGALFLVGLPELLREFAEFRLLMYGALLIVMMLAKPEGFWPSTTRQRELHAGEQEFEESVPAVSPTGD